ncbi:deoxycytidine triphosphate deaminase [candidate division BRC1 bacterium SM23_51]|nr:MAG: deoxycytidine triphosphate deaminase [candidate division BRC1 bacterium SM23_51]
MAVQPDHWIAQMAREHRMIEPFEPSQVRQAVISFGPSSYGYDLRLADEFRVFSPPADARLDPKQFEPGWFVEHRAARCEVPANSFVLARSLEYFRIPREVIAVCFGKSTYARCGLVVNVTPLEPEWEGYITMAISNTAPVPAILYANEGIAQVIFLRSDQTCDVSYGDRKGKYQAQKEITPPRVEQRNEPG